MPRGPRGERRPADVAQAALKVFRIAVGEETDELPCARRQSGLAGNRARALSLSKAERKLIAAKAAAARWKPTAKE